MRTTMSFIMAGLLLIAFASMSFAAKKNEKAWPNGIARPMPVPQWVQQQMNAQNEPLYHNNNFPVLPQGLYDPNVIPIILPPHDGRISPVDNNLNPALSPCLSRDIILEEADRYVNPSLSPYLSNSVVLPKIK